MGTFSVLVPDVRDRASALRSDVNGQRLVTRLLVRRKLPQWSEGIGAITVGCILVLFNECSSMHLLDHIRNRSWSFSGVNGRDPLSNRLFIAWFDRDHSVWASGCINIHWDLTETSPNA